MKMHFWMIVSVLAIVLTVLNARLLTEILASHSSAPVSGPVAAVGVDGGVEASPHGQMAASAHMLPSESNLLEQHVVLLEQYRNLMQRQELHINKLEASVADMVDNFDMLAHEFESLQPRKIWHEQHLSANGERYTAIRKFVEQIDHRLFPVVNTWYSEEWQKLTSCFSQNRFPTAGERDDLVKLIQAIQSGEAHRQEMRAEQGQVDPSAGYCLGSEWNAAITHLQELKY
jgi:hemerythrin-like domain-containing protein